MRPRSAPCWRSTPPRQALKSGYQRCIWPAWGFATPPKAIARRRARPLTSRWTRRPGNRAMTICGHGSIATWRPRWTPRATTARPRAAWKPPWSTGPMAPPSGRRWAARDSRPATPAGALEALHHAQRLKPTAAVTADLVLAELAVERRQPQAARRALARLEASRPDQAPSVRWDFALARAHQMAGDSATAQGRLPARSGTRRRRTGRAGTGAGAKRHLAKHHAGRWAERPASLGSNVRQTTRSVLTTDHRPSERIVRNLSVRVLYGIFSAWTRQAREFRFARPLPAEPGWSQRVIMHADMDAFYASVEQRERPANCAGGR